MILFFQGGPGQQGDYYDGSGDCCPPNMNMVSGQFSDTQVISVRLVTVALAPGCF